MPKKLKLNTNHIKALAEEAFEDGRIDEMSDALISDVESLYLGYNDDILEFVIYKEHEDDEFGTKEFDDFDIICHVNQLVSGFAELATNKKEEKAILDFTKQVYAND